MAGGGGAMAHSLPRFMRSAQADGAEDAPVAATDASFAASGLPTPTSFLPPVAFHAAAWPDR